MSIHTRNLQILVTEICKVKNGESPSIMREIVQIDNCINYNLRKDRGFKPGNPKTVYYGTETISALGPEIWIILPDEYKNSTCLKEFKAKSKNCLPLNCPVRLYMKDIRWLYLISIRSSIFNFFVQLVCLERN